MVRGGSRFSKFGTQEEPCRELTIAIGIDHRVVGLVFRGRLVPRVPARLDTVDRALAKVIIVRIVTLAQCREIA